jgi:hypothetical protein
MMMTMKLGKRIHRVAISLDDETYLALSHLANYDRKGKAREDPLPWIARS